MVKCKVNCKICNAEISYKNYAKHLKRMHREYFFSKNRKKLAKFGIKCPKCGEEQHTLKRLIQHAKLHDVDVLCKKLVFDNENDFRSWLDNEEKENCCRYLKNRRWGSAMQMICNRSGFFSSSVPMAERKRNLKMKGSIKIDGMCTAHLIQKEKDGKIDVTYFPTHFGHDCDPFYLNLAKREKEDIAIRLLQGVSEAKILNDAWEEGATKSVVTRMNLLNSSDLKNIKKEYNIRTERLNLCVEDVQILSVQASVDAELQRLKDKVLQQFEEVGQLLKSGAYQDDLLMSVSKHLSDLEQLLHTAPGRNSESLGEGGIHE